MSLQHAPASITSSRSLVHVLHAIALGLGICLLVVSDSHAQFQIPGDYNQDGAISHADYSILGDTLGSARDLRADGNGNGVVDLSDYLVYQAQYGFVGAAPIATPAVTTSGIPLELAVAPTPTGNLLWTFTLPSLDSALAGHMSITAVGTTILSMQGGDAFLDDFGALDVPGDNFPFGDVDYGLAIYTAQNSFAALGTTLGVSIPDSPLTFLTVETEGQNDTTLSFSGAYGYQGIDGDWNGSLTYYPVPEPASFAGVLAIAVALASRRRGH